MNIVFQFAPDGTIKMLMLTNCPGGIWSFSTILVLLVVLLVEYMESAGEEKAKKILCTIANEMVIDSVLDVLQIKDLVIKSSFCKIQ